MTVTYPVYINLKDLGRGDNLVLKQVVELQVGAEGGLLVLEVDGPDVGDVAVVYGCLRSTDIADERTSVDGWHMVQ